jgi:hypothetical protein
MDQIEIALAIALAMAIGFAGGYALRSICLLEDDEDFSASDERKSSEPLRPEGPRR